MGGEDRVRDRRLRQGLRIGLQRPQRRRAPDGPSRLHLRGDLRRNLGSRGPTGNTASYQDGSVRWRFFSPGINDGKTALNVACTAEAGSGQVWCTNFNFSVRYKGAGTAWGEEKDCNNANEDSNAGTRFFMACTFYGGGAAGTFPFLAYQFVGSGAVNAGGPAPYGAHSFIHIAGEPSDVGSVIKDHVLLDAGHSGSTIRALAGRRHEGGFLVDESDSRVILKGSGRHAGGGIDFKQATFPNGTAIAVPTSSFVEWDGGSYVGRNGAVGAFTIGRSTSGTAYGAAIWDNADLSYGNHLWSRGSAPALASCASGSLARGRPTTTAWCRFPPARKAAGSPSPPRAPRSRLAPSG